MTRNLLTVSVTFTGAVPSDPTFQIFSTFLYQSYFFFKIPTFPNFFLCFPTYSYFFLLFPACSYLVEIFLLFPNENKAFSYFFLLFPTFSYFFLLFPTFSYFFLLLTAFLFCFVTHNFKMHCVIIICQQFAAWCISQFGAPHDLKIFNLHPRSQREFPKCAVSVLLLSYLFLLFSYLCPTFSICSVLLLSNFFIRVCWTAWCTY